MARKVALLVAALALLACVSGVRADTFVTGTETVTESVFGGSGVFNLVNRIGGTGGGGQGGDFGNNINSSGGGNHVGDLVNIVVADKITGYSLFGGANPSSGFGNNVVLMVAAVQAKVTAVSGTGSTLQFQSGSLALFPTPNASYNPQHPATWNATGVPVALYSMAKPTDVVPGAKGQGDFFPASQVNVASFNSNSTVQSQAIVLFNEVRNGGFAVIDAIPNQTGVGQLAQTNAQVQLGGNIPVLTAADMAALNTIFQNLDPTAQTLSTFATFGTGTATDFLPANPAASGDAFQTIGISIDPGNFVTTSLIPEPATMSVWGLLLGSGGLGGMIRYYRSKRAAKA